MADTPLISKGRLEVIAGPGAAAQISRGRLEVIAGPGAAARISRARLEVICKLNGPQPEPFLGFYATGIGV